MTSGGSAGAYGGVVRSGRLMYAKRWSVERVSNRWKEQGQVERHCHFGLRRVSSHVGLQMLMSLAA